MTTVINLFAGSGAGKSTTAAGLFYEMKKEHHSVELVTEFVKRLAYQGIKPGPLDQCYLFAKQAKAEFDLYSKVKFIITDSPLLLAPIYEIRQQGESIVEPAVFRYLERSKKMGIEHVNFVLSRGSKFTPEGRFETLEEARQVDKIMLQYLRDNNVNYITVPSTDPDQRVKFIFDYLVYGK